MDIIEVDSETKEMLKTLVSCVCVLETSGGMHVSCVCRTSVTFTISKLLNSRLYKVDMAEGNRQDLGPLITLLLSSDD